MQGRLEKHFNEFSTGTGLVRYTDIRHRAIMRMYDPIETETSQDPFRTIIVPFLKSEKPFIARIYYLHSTLKLRSKLEPLEISTKTCGKQKYHVHYSKLYLLVPTLPTNFLKIKFFDDMNSSYFMTQCSLCSTQYNYVGRYCRYRPNYNESNVSSDYLVAQ